MRRNGIDQLIPRTLPHCVHEVIGDGKDSGAEISGRLRDTLGDPRLNGTPKKVYKVIVTGCMGYYCLD